MSDFRMPGFPPVPASLFGFSPVELPAPALLSLPDLPPAPAFAILMPEGLSKRQTELFLQRLEHSHRQLKESLPKDSAHAQGFLMADCSYCVFQMQEDYKAGRRETPTLTQAELDAALAYIQEREARMEDERPLVNDINW